MTDHSHIDAPPRTSARTASARVGHVHLKVADLDRAIAFYADLLGFPVTQRYGTGAAFLGAGGYHHHIGLNTWESAGATAPPPGHTGLYHAAFLYPDRRALAEVLARLRGAEVPFTGAADHGVSEAFYLDDPEGNGVELYVDRPEDAWPRDPAGNLAMVNRRIDIDAWIAKART